MINNVAGIDDNSSLKSKSYVLVTGGARGIGSGISLCLASRGFTVAAVGTRSPDNPAVVEFVQKLKSANSKCSYIQGDISSSDDRRYIIDEFYRRYGRLDVLVNNAGVAPTVRADLLEMTEESFDRVLGINLRGAFFLSQYAAKRMIADEPSGAPRMIITVTSISADVSSTNRGEYCISKAGLSMAVKLFADRLAPYGINSYEIRPGIIETDMTAGVKGKYEEKIEGGLLPIARMGQPEDIAKCVYALASGLFTYTTGSVFYIDGGFSLSRL